jgi:3-phenylpropionate/cinnamic acid dioxygenase small subunit
MKKFAAGVLMGLILTAGMVFTASKSDNDVLREVRDRAEIDDLMWRYARALDTNDADAYAAAYAPDGQFSAGGNPTKGRDALKNMIADLRQRQTDAQAKGEPKRPPMYHMSANERIQFTDKDHARIEAYYITAIAAGGAAVPLRVVGVGRSVDDVARVNGQWVIVSRNVSPQD